MAKKVRITYFGMEGEGKNVTEAKKDAGRKIERALSGWYTPVLIAARGKAMLLYREPVYGWSYAILHKYLDELETSGRPMTTVHGIGGSYTSQDEAEKAARRHLAQYIFEFDGPTGVEVIRDAQDRREHLDWCKWQHCYRAWRKAKPEGNDTEWHRLACYGNWPDGVEPWTWDGQS